MKILINYADANYRKTQKWNTWTGKRIGKFDKVYEFGPSKMDEEYKKKHKELLSIPRGNGLWLWKPYFILKVLEESNDGDVIFYADSGAFFVRKIDHLIRSFRENERIWVSDCPLMESCFTKSLCFTLMDCDVDEIRFSNQIQATYVMLICCEETKAFVREWLHWCENPQILMPEGDLSVSDCRGNGFVAHREDQSVLSLMCKKRGILPHRDPSQRAKFPETFYNRHYTYSVPEHPEDQYRTVIFLHKDKSPNLWVIAKWLLRALRSKIRYQKENSSEGF